MSCSDFSIDSLESSEFLNSNDKVKYAKQNTASNTEWRFDLMSVPLYSGPVSLRELKRIEVNGTDWRLFDLTTVPLYSGPVPLQELKRIEVNGDKISEIETKEFSSINKKKHLSNTTNISRLKNFKHPGRQGKYDCSRYHLKPIRK